MDHFYKQPKYFTKFRCIGGDCPDSCCDGWNVHWKPDELEKLKSVECSNDLKNNIINSFFYDEDKKFYTIKLCDDGRCPFHNRQTGLCDVQREFGEKYLGVICRRYPRHYIEKGNMIIRWCATSCPAVIDVLIKDYDSMDMEQVLARDYKNIDRNIITVDTDESVRLDPVRKKRIELLDFYTGMLLNKSRDIETSMILTALAVKHLTDAEAVGHYERMDKIMCDLEPQLNNPAAAASIGEIKPNYQLKFKLVNNMIVKFLGDNIGIVNIISSIHDGNELILEKYLTGLEKFNAAFDNKDHILKNIIMNTFYDMNMPLGKLKRPLFENYAYFVVAAAAIKTMAAAIGFSCENIKQQFKLCVAEMSRSFSHDTPKADAIAEDIKQMGLTTPAHLALIIKG